MLYKIPFFCVVQNSCFLWCTIFLKNGMMYLIPVWHVVPSSVVGKSFFSNFECCTIFWCIQVCVPGWSTSGSLRNETVHPRSNFIVNNSSAILHFPSQNVSVWKNTDESLFRWRRRARRRATPDFKTPVGAEQDQRAWNPTPVLHVASEGAKWSWRNGYWLLLILQQSEAEEVLEAFPPPVYRLSKIIWRMISSAHHINIEFYKVSVPRFRTCICPRFQFIAWRFDTRCTIPKYWKPPSLFLANSGCSKD